MLAHCRIQESCRCKILGMTSQGRYNLLHQGAHMLVHSPKELALQVSSRRKKIKLSQTSVGELVGVKQATVSAFENNPEGTKLETLFSILAAVGVEMYLEPKDHQRSADIPWTEEW